MPPSTLQVDVYVAPIIPFSNPSPTASASTSQWSPISCTLIHGPETAILVDTPITIPQTEELIAWIMTTIPHKKLTHTFTTHAHPDHYLGLPVLAEAFPGLVHLATASVVEGIKHSYEPEHFALWAAFFPGALLHPGRVVPEALPSSNEFSLDGFGMKAYDVDHSDCSSSSFLHVPSLDLIVAGDIIYGDCYQMLAECNTSSKRKQWLKAIDQIETLNPKIVVPGHKRASQIDGAYLIGQTREYLEVFGELLGLSVSVDDLGNRVKTRFPERWNGFILEVSCMASWAGRDL